MGKIYLWVKWGLPFVAVGLFLIYHFGILLPLLNHTKIPESYLYSISISIFEIVGLSLIVAGMNKEKKIKQSIIDWWKSRPNSTITPMNLELGGMKLQGGDARMTIRTAKDSIEELRKDLEKLSNELFFYKTEVKNMISDTKVELRIDIKNMKKEIETREKESKVIQGYQRHLEVVGLIFSIYGIFLGILINI